MIKVFLVHPNTDKKLTEFTLVKIFSREGIDGNKLSQ